jgi:hypothetical protein
LGIKKAGPLTLPVSLMVDIVKKSPLNITYQIRSLIPDDFTLLTIFIISSFWQQAAEAVVHREDPEMKHPLEILSLL